MFWKVLCALASLEFVRAQDHQVDILPNYSSGSISVGSSSDTIHAVNLQRRLAKKKKNSGPSKQEYWSNMAKGVRVVATPVQGKQPRFKGGYYPAYEGIGFRNPNIYLNRRRLGPKHNTFAGPIPRIPARGPIQQSKINQVTVAANPMFKQAKITRVVRQETKGKGMGSNWPYVRRLGPVRTVDRYPSKAGGYRMSKKSTDITSVPHGKGSREIKARLASRRREPYQTVSKNWSSYSGHQHKRILLSDVKE